MEEAGSHLVGAADHQIHRQPCVRVVTVERIVDIDALAHPVVPPRARIGFEGLRVAPRARAAARAAHVAKARVVLERIAGPAQIDVLRQPHGQCVLGHRDGAARRAVHDRHGRPPVAIAGDVPVLQPVADDALGLPRGEHRVEVAHGGRAARTGRRRGERVPLGERAVRRHRVGAAGARRVAGRVFDDDRQLDGARRAGGLRNVREQDRLAGLNPVAKRGGGERMPPPDGDEPHSGQPPGIVEVQREPVRAAANRQAQAQALAPADPVAMDLLHFIGPAREPIQPVEHFVRERRFAHEPLRLHDRADDALAAPAPPVVDEARGERHLALRAPRDRRIAPEAVAGLEQPQEHPLNPAVVRRHVILRDAPAVVPEPEPHELRGHRLAAFAREALGRAARLPRGQLGRQAERVEACRIQHVVALHSPKPRVGIGEHVVPRVPHVQLARRERRQFDDEPLRPPRLRIRVEQARIAPCALPARLERLRPIRRRVARLVRVRGAHVQHSTARTWSRYARGSTSAAASR